MTPYKKVLYHTLVNWLPFAVVIIVFSGLAYVLVQQNYRMSANDPQVQVAEDVVAAINKGQSADGLVPAQGTAELGESLAPFLLVFSNSNTLIGSSILVDGKNPSFPSSALEASQAKGQSRITWQPKPGVRAAVVIMPYKGKETGYIVVGRSLREVENRDSKALLMSELAGLAALALTFIIILLSTSKTVKHMHVEKITEIEIKSET